MINETEFGELRAITAENSKAIERNARQITWLYRTAITILVALVVSVFIKPLIENAMIKRDIKTEVREGQIDGRKIDSRSLMICGDTVAVFANDNENKKELCLTEKMEE